MHSATMSLRETVRGGKNNWVNSTAIATQAQRQKIRPAATRRPAVDLTPRTSAARSRYASGI
jgi:hypothetical protein